MHRATLLAKQANSTGPGGLERRGNHVAVLRLNNPPLNALGAAVRAQIREGMAAAEADASIDVVVITGAGPAFCAGADIAELGKMASNASNVAVEASLREFGDVMSLLESTSKVTVAAINGLCFGGGCETALACHHRVAHPRAQLGLPEVTLGLLPGAGGTQRLPRLVGLEPAIRMCCFGAPVKAAAAAKVGLVDEVCAATDDVVAVAAAYGQAVAERRKQGEAPRRVRDFAERLPTAEQAAQIVSASRALIAKKTPKAVIAPLRNLDAVAAAATHPANFDAGVAVERRLFAELIASAPAAAQLHGFIAERRALKVPGIAGVKPARVKHVGVVGGGTMGGGIAMCFLNIGVPVTLLETSDARKANCVATIRRNYAVSAKRGTLSSAQLEARMGLLTVVVDDWAALGPVDFVIEAVFENMALKKEIFAKLDKVCKPGCVLASNTSSLDVDAIASATSRPQHVIGAHFFSPANIMKLLELVRGKATDARTIATSVFVAKAIKKAPVVVGNCFGFVGNRIAFQSQFQAFAMLEEGAVPRQIDAVIEAFGFRMGVCRMGDLAGVDIGYKVRQEMPAHLRPTRDVNTVTNMLVERGWHGQKTGRGYYKYAKDAPRVAVHDPEVDALCAQVSATKGVTRREISDEEIHERYFLAQINEAAIILEEGIAVRPSDVDVVMLYGYGYPAYRGGPCHYADALGLPNVVAAMRRYNARLGDATFPKPCPLLTDLAAKGASFASLNARR